jgi:hypothetical protein
VKDAEGSRKLEQEILGVGVKGRQCSRLPALLQLVKGCQSNNDVEEDLQISVEVLSRRWVDGGTVGKSSGCLLWKSRVATNQNSGGKGEDGKRVRPGSQRGGIRALAMISMREGEKYSPNASITIPR